MEPILFKNVALGEVFYLKCNYGSIPLLKYELDKGLILANIHYAYQMGMFKKFDENKQVLIN